MDLTAATRSEIRRVDSFTSDSRVAIDRELATHSSPPRHCMAHECRMSAGPLTTKSGARRQARAVVFAVGVTLAVVFATIAALAVAERLAESRRHRVPDSVVQQMPAQLHFIADVQMRNPTDAFYYRYLGLQPPPPPSTLAGQRHEVWRLLGESGWDTSAGESSVKAGVSLSITQLSTLRAEQPSAAALVVSDLPVDLRDRDLLVLVLV
jgi:hypothetical protein